MSCRLSFYEAKNLSNTFRSCATKLTNIYVKRDDADNFVIAGRVIGGDEEKVFSTLAEYYEWAKGPKKLEWGSDANGSPVLS